MFLLFLGDKIAREGGFEKLLVCLEDLSTPLEWMTLVVQILGSISTMFYRPYVTKVTRRVDKAIYNYIFNNTDNNIR